MPKDHTDWAVRGHKSVEESNLATTRILVVEDFRSYRQLIAGLLSKNPDFEIIAEVSDGPDAVAQAKQRSPDVVLLDIGLPTLNGLEVGRQIRVSALSAKIIFVTQENDADVVREAFGIGAWGYVLKENAECDLLPAVLSVLEGVRFASKGLGDF